ncbi:MAG: hypothetical protein WBA93_18870 [Microcoleaceae cyanobacterium]
MSIERWIGSLQAVNYETQANKLVEKIDAIASLQAVNYETQTNKLVEKSATVVPYSIKLPRFICSLSIASNRA